VWLLRPAVISTILHLIESKQYEKYHHEKIAEYISTLAFLLLRLKGGIAPQQFLDLLSAMIAKVKLTYSSLQFPHFTPNNPTSITISLLDSSTSSSSSSSITKQKKTSVEQDSIISNLH
jgi:hypothetical protein